MIGVVSYFGLVRRLRRLEPMARWFVTVRCQRAQFRLRPDTSRRHAFGLFLGRALKAFPGVRLLAAVQMSNHLHLVVEDRESQLDRFMAMFLSPLAKALNAIDRTRGSVWERRYSAIQIVDEGALLDRIVYTALNPISAHLVDRVEQWPGLLLVPGYAECGRYTRFRKRAYEEARAHNAEAKMADFEEWVDVSVDVPEGLDEEVKRRVEARLSERPKNQRALGIEKVLAQSPFDGPQKPKWGPAPLCHASSIAKWFEYRDRWRAFVAEYQAASQAFRRGLLEIAFPDWSFRPSFASFGR